MINGRSSQTTGRALSALRQDFPDAEFIAVAANLATADGAQAVLDIAGDVDILVNNLGIFGAKPALQITDAEWRHYFEVNVLSAVRLIRSAVPTMIEHGWGPIVNIAK